MAIMLKEVLPGVLLLCFFILAHASEHCKDSTQLPEGCLCIKDRDQKNYASLHCGHISLDKLEKAFAKTYQNTETYYELQIHDVDLTGIGDIPEHMHTIHSLKMVKISGISEEKLKSLIDPLSDLKYLTIDSWNIPHITRGMFGHKAMLEMLDLSNNEIERVDDDALENLPNLKLLRLEGNKLRGIPKAVLKLDKLKTLDLGVNEIREVSDQDTQDLKAKQVKLIMNSVDCSCALKDSPFRQWMRDSNTETVSCSSPDELVDKEVKMLTDEHLCPGSGADAIKASILLLSVVAIFCA